MKHFIQKVLRYASVTLISYVALLFGTYVGVELFNQSPVLVCPGVLTLVYIGVYFASSLYVFKSHQYTKQWKRFTLAVVVFWLLNAVLYTILVESLEVQYLLSVGVNILVFGPLRYFVYQTFVFKEELK